MHIDPYSYLGVEKREGVAYVTFNRNTWALAEEWELFQLVEDMRTDVDVHAIVLSGTGDTFCGGAHHGDDPFDAYDYYERSCRLFGGFVDMDKPLVVAINGPASGSGLTLAMLGDVVYAERQVTFRDAHVLGGVVSATGPFLWPPSMGLLRAKRYLLTGDPFSAEEAQDMGLVTEVVDTGTSRDHAAAMAKRLAEIRPAAVQGTKRALNQWLKQAFGPVFQTALSYEFMRFPAEYAARTGTGQH